MARWDFKICNTNTILDWNFQSNQFDWPGTKSSGNPLALVDSLVHWIHPFRLLLPFRNGKEFFAFQIEDCNHYLHLRFSISPLSLASHSPTNWSINPDSPPAQSALLTGSLPIAEFKQLKASIANLLAISNYVLIEKKAIFKIAFHCRRRECRKNVEMFFRLTSETLETLPMTERSASPGKIWAIKIYKLKSIGNSNYQISPICLTAFVGQLPIRWMEKWFRSNLIAGNPRSR